MTSVSTPRLEYVNALDDVQRNRAAVKGERAVKALKTILLPPLASMCCETCVDTSGQSRLNQTATLTLEGQAAYNKYIGNAYFYGATGRTVAGLVGLIFSKNPVEEVPASVQYLEDNADSKGNSLRFIAKTACFEAQVTPRSGLLVARPSTPQGASVATVESQNLRPKILNYKFESIINWDYQVINNIEKLSLVVLVEQISVRKGFEVKVEKQYRVLELIDNVYHQSLYNNSSSQITPPTPVMVNGATSDEIPFYWIESDSDNKAPINDLVDANMEHYNLYADYGSKLHYSSFVIYTETGAQPGTNNLMGNGVKWNNPETDAEFGVLQPDGNSDAHRIALQDMEQRMAALGAEQLRPASSSAESAEAKSLDRVAQNSTTADVAITVSEALTKAINFASRWMGGTEDTVYQLNTDYNPTGLDSQSLTALTATWQGGGISYDTYYENLQRGEIASSDRTAEQEQALISDNNV
jgi:hypothetical protein